MADIHSLSWLLLHLVCFHCAWLLLHLMCVHCACHVADFCWNGHPHLLGHCSKIAEAEAAVSVNKNKWLVMHVHVQMRTCCVGHAVVM
jgi:hypothetical protein